MIPELLTLGPLPVHSFGLMIALAIFAGIACLTRSFVRQGLPADLAERYVLVAGVGGLIGARIWYVVTHLDSLEGSVVDALLSTAGFTFYGGFIFSSMLLAIMAIRDRLPFRQFMDTLGPALCIGYAIGRLGCQLSGDGDYGKVTSSVFGMSYQSGVVPTPPGVLVYPTPLFESVISFVAFFILLQGEKAKKPLAPGRLFAVYLILLALERFFIEFLRIEPRVLAGFTEAQVIAVVLLVAGLLLFALVPRGNASACSSSSNA